ncbi:hypothetical protein AB0K51_17090 [Kitasatospora sp. NPDC049285]|uniref:hypothetical protein n=1 Tax=Kitasatospora sp. NPDC049285 TaxID=3157096 RepID=UPI00342F4C40
MRAFRSPAEISLGVVDDHPPFRAGLLAGLTAAGFRSLTVAGSTEELGDLRPEVVLCDLEFPEGCRSGREAVEYLVARGCLVIGFSHLARREAQLDVLAGGARGFVMKSEETSVYCEAAGEVARGGYWIGPRLAGYLIEDADNRPLAKDEIGPAERALLTALAEGDTQAEFEHAAKLPDGGSIPLMDRVFDAERRRNRVITPSVREFQIVELIGRQGLRSAEAARRLFITEATLKSHLENIRDKYLLAHPHAPRDLPPRDASRRWAEEFDGRRS